MLNWTKEEAKQYLVSYHYLNQKQSPSILEVFQRIQSIQNDPLSVVGHNQELVLQARIDSFKRKDLYHALYHERYLIDGWDKQACIFLTEDFPIFQPVRERLASEKRSGIQKYLGFDVWNHMDEVLSYIRDSGATFSREIQTGETINTGWWHTKPSSMAIDYLYAIGKLGIESRYHTQKRYDLIERLIPNATVPSPYKTEVEFMEYYLLRRIKALGMSWNKSGNHFMDTHLKSKGHRAKALQRLLARGLVTEVQVEGLSDICYIPSDAKNLPIDVLSRITFLAPLDNMIWDRLLVKELFDFDYTWEVYVPAKKRKYGYYVLPILYGYNFIGRIEFEKHRNSDPLIVKKVWWEDTVRVTKDIERKLDSALRRFARYLGTKEIQYEK